MSYYTYPSNYGGGGFDPFPTFDPYYIQPGPVEPVDPKPQAGPQTGPQTGPSDQDDILVMIARRCQNMTATEWLLVVNLLLLLYIAMK